MSLSFSLPTAGFVTVGLYYSRVDAYLDPLSVRRDKFIFHKPSSAHDALTFQCGRAG